MEPLSEQEIRNAVSNLNGWEHGNDKIKKKFEFGDFKEALAFIVRIGLEAEKLGHHPGLFNVYNTVKIELSTHDADDKVTQKDIDLATAIEGII